MMARTQIEERYLNKLTEREFPTLTPMESDQVMGETQDTMPADAPMQLAMAGDEQPGFGGVSAGQFMRGLADTGALGVKGAAQGFVGLPGDLISLMRGAFDFAKSGGDFDALVAGLDKPTGLPTTEEVKTFFDRVAPLGPDQMLSEVYRNNPDDAGVTETAGEFLAPGGYIKGAKDAVRALKSVAPGTVNKAVDAMKDIPAGMSIQDVSPGGIPGIIEDAPRLMQERVPGVQPGEELIVQHNLTASNLLKADKLGGLPVPSLAISRAANPMDNFGEITLIAPREFAVPSAKNPVFKADAYTPRFPSIDFQIDAKSTKNLDKFMADVADVIPDGKRKMGSLTQDWRNRQYSDLMRAKFLSERGELPDPKDFDNTMLFQQTMSRRIDSLQPEYAEWVNALDGRLAEAGVNVKERIFKGFTYNGDRRYAAATLDNIVKEMKGGAGGEGFNYGVGNLRAVASPKFRTFAQVKAARGRIVDGKQMDEIKGQAQDAYVDILNRMREVNGQYSAEDALLEFAQTKRISALNEIYDGKMPDALKADIGIFLQKIQELPTEYFELKPQRAVMLDEFKGAIIPKDTPKAARDVLNKAGITEVYEYGTPDERKALFQKYGKEMFTAAPAGAGLGATMQDKEQE